MKKLLLPILGLAGTMTLSAELAFRDDAPAGFIHLVDDLVDAKDKPNDIYLQGANIVAVTVRTNRDSDGKASHEVEIRTNGTESSASYISSTQTAMNVRSLSWRLEFKTREEAEVCVRKIMFLAKQ